MMDTFLFVCIFALVSYILFLRYRLNEIDETFKSAINIILSDNERLNIIEDFFKVQSKEMTAEEYQKKWGMDSARTKDSNIP